MPRDPSITIPTMIVTNPSAAFPSLSPFRFDDPPPVHGGGLRQAALQFGIPLTDWLDLSTGINPQPWVAPPLPQSVWARLPEEEDALESMAACYYGAAHPLPVAGSQAAIQALPMLRAPCRVGVPALGYREHAHAWRRAGHAVVALADGDPRSVLAEGPDRLDCLVVINPNNPTGRRWPVSLLLEWLERLAEHGGWLVVDEAFMDTTPEQSLAPYAGRPGLVLLRSLGKFFGLAGARVGFVWTEPRLQARLRHWLGPWTLSGPSRLVAQLALADASWQTATRAGLAQAGRRLADLLCRQGLPPSGGTALFQWVRADDAPMIQERLARQGILVRCFDRPPSLRFGLPGAEGEWRRLEEALATLHSGDDRPAVSFEVDAR